jgi:hypothetical protein
LLRLAALGSIFRHRIAAPGGVGYRPLFSICSNTAIELYHPTELRREVRKCAKVLDAIGDALDFLGCGMSIRKGVNEKGRDRKTGLKMMIRE